jgi:hypothetical protein
MTKPDSPDVKAPPERSPSPCEAPHVESVVTPEALAREIHYAGTGSGDQEG